MSEANVPPRHDSSDDLDALARENRAAAQSSEPPYRRQADWEAVPLPGTFPTVDAAAPSIAGNASGSSREAELLALIRDLNRCNEVLLSRVHQLQDALDSSQKALQQEVERSQHVTDEERVAAAQQQSVAQLLHELEQANAALKRQTILSETLQAQLETAQEQNKHLERECALLQKQHSEKAQKAQQLEETCRDLRSRLQRQQRYTLQFKAALEKSLDASPGHSPSGLSRDTASSDLPTMTPLSPGLNPAVMPRSERIQPWSAVETGTPTDAHLLSLVRSHKEADLADAPAIEPVESAAPSPSTPELAVDGEAEQKLWQDVERVIESSASTSSSAASMSSAPTSSQDTQAEAQFTEPIPWGAPVQKASERPEAHPAPPPTQPDTVPTARTTPPPSTAFSAAAVSPQTTPKAPVTHSIPALEALSTAQSSPSPIVHPLRPPQRKRKSLSAVELPSFPPLPKPQQKSE